MYIRMSTEHQQYSTHNQSEAIEKYAARRNLLIVKRFVDHGKSGLTLLAGKPSVICCTKLNQETLTSRLSSSTTLAAGGGFRMRMRAPITNMHLTGARPGSLLC